MFTNIVGDILCCIPDRPLHWNTCRI